LNAQNVKRKTHLLASSVAVAGQSLSNDLHIPLFLFLFRSTYLDKAEPQFPQNFIVAGIFELHFWQVICGWG
jgi:hypothetical protein